MSFRETPLLISGSATEGGGLFSLVDGRVAQIDRLTTMGLCIADGRVARLLKSPDPTETVTELLTYDERGVDRYYRLDGLGDPHDVAWTGTHYLIVSSIQNRVSWVRRDGTIERTWEAPGENDSWHINCLHQHAGLWYLSVFGKFATHRGWSNDTAGTSGFLLRLDDNEEVVTGLSQPHTPRFIDGGWVICNSVTHELLKIEPGSQRVERRLQLDGYVRGIAVVDDVLFVGISAGRYAQERSSAAICAIDRATWQLIERFEVPTKEIYDLLPVTRAQLDGLAAGFRTSRFRTNEHDQYYLFQRAGVEPTRLWATGEPLPHDACAVTIEARFPATVIAEQTIEVPVKVTNTGNAIYVTAPPHPVYICYRWHRADDGSPAGQGQWLHTPLPRALPPAATLETTIPIAAPDSAGAYTLAITLLQEGIAWFDDVRASNASRHDVLVRVPAVV